MYSSRLRFFEFVEEEDEDEDEDNTADDDEEAVSSSLSSSLGTTAGTSHSSTRNFKSRINRVHHCYSSIIFCSSKHNIIDLSLDCYNVR